MLHHLLEAGDVIGRDQSGRTLIQLAVDDWTLEQLLIFDAGAEDLEEEDDCDEGPAVLSFDRVPARRSTVGGRLQDSGECWCVGRWPWTPPAGRCLSPRERSRRQLRKVAHRQGLRRRPAVVGLFRDAPHESAEGRLEPSPFGWRQWSCSAFGFSAFILAPPLCWSAPRSCPERPDRC